MSKLLKDCPFCGSEAHISTEYETDGSDCTWKFVRCSKCGARTRGKWFSGHNDCPIFYEEVRDEWNQRTDK